MATQYSAKDITVLEGLEPVRERPAMYIGGTGKTGFHHLVWEIVDNSIDEVINKHATRVEVVLEKGKKTISVEDNGRGIPVDTIKKYKKSALEVILTTLHAGGKFDNSKSYAHSGGLHGVGSSVVNALSSLLEVTVRRGGNSYHQTYSRGKVKSKIKKTKNARGTGTKITFTPDEQIFGTKLVFDPKTIAERLEAKSYLHRGVKIVFRNNASAKQEVFTYQHDEGITEFLSKIISDRGKQPVPPTSVPFYFQSTGETTLEVALSWTEATDDYVRSYANGVPTTIGGTHENGFRNAVSKAIRNYVSTHKLAPKGLSLIADDIREGLVAILSVYVSHPQFQGQTKDRLNNPEVTAQVESTLRPALENYLNQNKPTAEAIVARIILSARARVASRAASQAVTRKTAISHRLNLPGKLADCSSTNPTESELFIVEGDSAGGSAKQARERKNQAILPLRGKVLNAEQASLAKLMDNKELGNIISALGCGMGPNMDLTKLRYHKIFLLMDADADGHHIATLLLTFLFRHMRPLIENGHIYLAQPPLYRIDIGKKTFWALDEITRDKILETHLKGNAKPNITRFKGLGEMNPDILKKTTLDPESRASVRVRVFPGEELQTDQTIANLMGKDAHARYTMITEGVTDAGVLDI